MSDTSPTIVSWTESTGQMRYSLAWHGTVGEVWLSGVNLNDGTEWASDTPVKEPQRFGNFATIPGFVRWAAQFIGKDL